MNLIDDETRVIDILVKSGRTVNAWGDPIHQVDKEMRWTSADTRKFVEDLLRRNLVVLKVDSLNRLNEGERLQTMKYWWARPDEEL